MSSPLPDQSSGFIPRKEFQQSPRRHPSSFSLLCLAGTNLLRLYSFPSSIVAVFRRFFDSRNAIHSEKTDSNNNFVQFELEGKLWTTKSLSTERLLVEMLNIIYQSGFTFLSTIDYGREADDRLAIAFSRPCLPSEFSSPSSSSSPRIPALAPIPDLPKPRVPFALSFPSATVLRVICPPLHSTPAILQAVRGAWPRGVQSEKKVGENSFEFKLKGYRWFQEDTFATDSLRYILALLSSLDSHSFTLQASVCLTNRSRNKDLWIFTGPPPPDDFDSPPPSILNTSHSDFHHGSHKRIATEPIGSPSPLPPSYHGRSVTDNVGQRYLQGSPAGSSGSLPSPGLRKAAPRAQVPISVHDTDDMPEALLYRADLPSTIPDGAENMTGVGAAHPTPDVFYSTPPFGDATAEPVLVSPRIDVPPSRSSSPRETPPLHHTSTSNSGTDDPTLDTPSPEPKEMDGELLSPGVFKDSVIYRDSAYSSMTDFSADVPIKWTGAQRESQQIKEERRISEAPKFPGGWEPTPIEEKEEPELKAGAPLDIRLGQDKAPEGPLHDVRVASPEITSPDDIRKSEAGLVEIPASSTPPPPLPTNADVPSAVKGKEREAGSGVGWVMINVDGKNNTATSPTAATSLASQDAIVVSPTAESHHAMDTPNTDTTASSKSSVHEPQHPKTVVFAEEKKKERSKKDSPSRFKRLLSITRRDPNKAGVDEGSTTPPQEKRPLMRSLRSFGPPEAKRNENSRRSFD